MCLGDLRFQPFVRSSGRRFTLGTSWAEILAPNLNRVGILFAPSDAADYYVWPFTEGATGDNGIFIDFATTPYVHISLATHGDIVSNAWRAKGAAGTPIILVIEQEAPAWVIGQIREMGLGGKWQKGQDPFPAA